ncbi:MAG: VCBS repeat-containing protein [Deinococcales bacterium]
MLYSIPHDSLTPDISSGAVFADYDNDGWADLYLLNLGKNRLYRNEGARFQGQKGQIHFSDVTDEGWGMKVGQSAAWGDYDHDGWLDLYVVNHISPRGSADKLYHSRMGVLKMCHIF